MPKTSQIDWTVTIQNVSTTIGPTNVYELDDLTGNPCNGMWNKLFTNVPVGTYSVTLKRGADWPCVQAHQTQINIVVTAGGTVPVTFHVGKCCP